MDASNQTQPHAMTDAVKLALDADFGCALRQQGSIECWSAAVCVLLFPFLVLFSH
jgi:hypothetical protein